MQYSIENFWSVRLFGSNGAQTDSLPGWTNILEGLPTFVEAPIKLSESYGQIDPTESGVILVSAPGAVGKTTLAKQIAFETGAVFLDLSTADPVGANTLVGGLAASGLYEKFRSGSVGLIIDGLDEARMRVTQESMGAFMRDVVRLSRPDRCPIVLMGRTGAVQEAWLWLLEAGIETPVLEIGYFDRDQASEFARLQIQHIRHEENRREPDGRAVDLILERLSNATLKDGGSFVGYSPVLLAVAKRVADPEDKENRNTQELIARIERGEEVFTLESISNGIMIREMGKLRSLSFRDDSLRNRLYTPEEQISRLVARIYGTQPNFPLPEMATDDQEIYANALESWVQDHPFLDAEGRNPSSAVFGGLLAARALRDRAAASAALFQELSKGTAVNPFLAEFYISSIDSGRETPSIQAEHLGALYASIRARLSLGEFASLMVDGEVDEDAEAGGLAEIEIVRGNQSAIQEPLCFKIDAAGSILFGPHVEDIDVVAPYASVSIAYGSEAVLVAPIYIETGLLSLDIERLVAELPATASSTDPGETSSVRIIASETDAQRITTRPIRRGDVSLRVTWPNSHVYPWIDFSVPSVEEYDERTDEALRRLKKILRLFRSHSRNQLAKYRAAIDHRRRTKGVGHLVRDQLLEEGVLTIDGQMYFLNPDRLAEATGLNFHDVRNATVRPKTIDFIQRALAREQ